MKKAEIDFEKKSVQTKMSKCEKTNSKYNSKSKRKSMDFEFKPK